MAGFFNDENHEYLELEPASRSSSENKKVSAKEGKRSSCLCSCWTFVLTLAHVFIIENRGALIVPITTKGILQDITLTLTITDAESNFHKIAKRELCDPDPGKRTTVGQVVRGTKEDIVQYMISTPFSWNNNFTSSHSYIVGSFKGLLPKVVWILLVWMVVFAVKLTHDLCKDGIYDYRSGAYLHFTYTLQCRLWFLFMVRSLLVVSVLLCAAFTVFLLLDEGPVWLGRNYSSILVNFGTLAYGMLNLRRAQFPAFHWRSEKFKKMEFKRPFGFSGGLYIEKNIHFSDLLQGALIAYRRRGGDEEPLQPFLTDVADAETLWAEMRDADASSPASPRKTSPPSPQTTDTEEEYVVEENPWLPKKR